MRFYMNFSRFIALFFLFLLPGCAPSSNKQVTRILTGYIPQKVTQSAQVTPAQPAISIWVHGTRFFPEPVLKKFFYCKDGLHHYTSLDPSYRHYKLAQTLIECDPERYDAQHFYLFGWSGALSFKEREKAARKLYLQLKKLREEYVQKFGIEPIIRILAHSHGGNVSLLLEKVKDTHDTAFTIEELILLATPVQAETQQCAHASLFKKIYSLYSHLDSLQVIDPQGLQTKGSPLFSERRFKNDDKICQCAIKMNGRYLMHVEFIKGKFLCKLPFVLTALDAWQKDLAFKNENWHAAPRCLNVAIKNDSSKANWQAL